jgi:hypothetical protein
VTVGTSRRGSAWTGEVQRGHLLWSSAVQGSGIISATFREGGVHKATYWSLRTDTVKSLQEILIDYIDAE